MFVASTAIDKKTLSTDTILVSKWQIHQVDTGDLGLALGSNKIFELVQKHENTKIVCGECVFVEKLEPVERSTPSQV